MGDSRDLCFVSATRLARLYRARKASPLEVMQAILARIDAVNPVVNAYVTVARESALAEARVATRALGRKGTALPPLHGVPVSIKDLTATKGIRTTWSSLIYRHYVPGEDDLVVQRLKAAGAIVVGKTNTPEFGAGGNTCNAVFGATRNPWNAALSCGGSSGGAAVAVATGVGPIAQGSDLGGSLRTPAAGGVPHHARARPHTPPHARVGHPRGHWADRALSPTSPSCSRQWPGPTTALRYRTRSIQVSSPAR